MIFVVDALPCLPRVVSSWLLGEILRPLPQQRDTGHSVQPGGMLRALRLFVLHVTLVLPLIIIIIFTISFVSVVFTILPAQ